MNLHVENPTLVFVALRAVKTVATARGPLHPTQRAMMDLAQRLVLGSSVDVDALLAIEPEELALALPAGAARERVVRGMVFVCLARGEVSPEEATLVERYAAALGVELHIVENLRQLAEGHLALLRFDVSRRAFTGQALAQMVETEGMLGLLRGVASRAGLIDDQATAERFEALGSYPLGTLGRELHDYYLRYHFPLPGRRHALPTFGVVHDLCHVLSGYGIDDGGELEVVAFQAGFMQTDPPSTLLFIVLQAHLGLRLVSIAPGNQGLLDDPILLERTIRAFRRGTQVRVDLFDHWDYAALFAEPIEAVRASLGVPPASPAIS